jgi:hypothetical protein
MISRKRSQSGNFAEVMFFTPTTAADRGGRGLQSINACRATRMDSGREASGYTLPRANSKQPLTCFERMRRTMINTLCAELRPLLGRQRPPVARRQQLRQPGVPLPRRLLRRSPPGTHPERRRRRLLPWCSEPRSFLRTIERWLRAS